MGQVRQNPIKTTVRSAHVCIHCTVQCAQLLRTALHRTDLIIFPLIPRLHDTASCQNGSHNRVERTATVRTTGCQIGLYNQFDNRLHARYSRLSNGFDKRFDNRLYRVNGVLHALLIYDSSDFCCHSKQVSQRQPNRDPLS